MKASSPAISTEVAARETAPDARVNIGTRRLSLVAEEAEARRRSIGAPIWEPVEREPGGLPTTDEVLNAMRPPEQLPAELEASIVATLTRALRPDESHHTGNANRERELLAQFASLTPVQAYHLRRRLDLDRNNDALAVAFRRLLITRRQRLRAFLADTRRRMMIATE